MRLFAAILLFSIPLFTFSQTFEIYSGDTINRKDINGKKQGHWKIFGKMKPTLGFQPDQVVEEGNYKDNRKNGVWNKYYPTGTIKAKITYKNNRPNGEYTTYNEKGEETENGTWPAKSKWQGTYKKRDSNIGPPGGWPGQREPLEYKIYNDPTTMYLPDGTRFRIYKGDTVNRMTSSGKRIGRWVYLGQDYSMSRYNSDQIVKEGTYEDGKKTGRWKWYSTHGQFSYFVDYQNNRPTASRIRSKELYALISNLKNIEPIMGKTVRNRIKSYEIYNGDTINRLDSNGRKHGLWFIFGKDRPRNNQFAAEAIIENGVYQNNRKVGYWTQFHPNGNIQIRMQYLKGRPSGPYVKFYVKGKIQEEGEWYVNKQVGWFATYYKSGCLQQEKFFNPAGKSDSSFYYLDDCKEGLKGTVEHSMLNSNITYPEPEPIIPPPDPPGPPWPIPPKKEPPCNGYQKRYNDNRDIEFDGEFKDCKLWNGKWYKYDKNGLLIKVEIYKNVRYVGDGVIRD